MGTLLQDLKYGARMMARSPVVSAVAILSLALAITANATTFSIVNSFMLEPFPYADQDRLVLLRTLRRGDGLDLAGGVSVPNFRDYVEAGSGLSAATLYTIETANLTGLETPEQLNVIVGTPSLFDVFGVPPTLGRGFRPEEGVEGAGNVLVLHHDFWQRRFLGDRSVLGRTVTLDGAAYTVVGVMPEEFDVVPANVQAFRPSDFADQMENRTSRGYLAFARLRDGATVEQVSAELQGPHARIAAENPDGLRDIDLLVQPAREFFPGPTDTQLVLLLAAVTLFGLLIACANVANLLLSRAEERQREVAVRTAIGAGRGRILTQLLTESVLMGAVAGAIGVTLAIWTVAWLQGAMPPQMPDAMTPRLAPEVVGMTLLLAVLAGVLFGLAPAVQAVGGDLRDALTNGARGGTAGRRRKRLRNAFVVGEIAIALALLSGSGFLIEAFQSVSTVDPGFRTEGLLTFQIGVLEDRYEGDAEVTAYQRELIRTLEAVPGVEGVAVMSSLPRGQNNPRASYTVDGRPEPDPSSPQAADLQRVNVGYFETMEVELRSGRLFNEADRLDAPEVAIVSEAFAAREFPEQEAVGMAITVAGASRRIVGVVETILQDRIRIAGRAGEQIYLPIEQAPSSLPSFAVRSTGDAAALSADVRQAVWSVQPDQPVALLRTFEAHVAESLAGPRSIALFLMVIGAIALVLAAMGVYGVMAHSVVQQHKEIGIRMALGAGRRSIVGMVTRSGLLLVVLGVALGLPLAFLMFRGTLVGLNLFEMEMGYTYPFVLAGSLIAVAVLATVVPAGQASGVVPVSALKE